MIVGTVNARLEAIVRLRLRGPTGIETVVDAVIDSGYTGSLTLPTAMVAALGLLRQSGGSAPLADGSTRSFDIFAAEVDWDGAWRAVLVSALGDEPLLECGSWRGTSCGLTYRQQVLWKSRQDPETRPGRLLRRTPSRMPFARASRARACACVAVIAQ
jgi:predicted aspartyl protease